MQSNSFSLRKLVVVQMTGHGSSIFHPQLSRPKPFPLTSTAAPLGSCSSSRWSLRLWRSVTLGTLGTCATRSAIPFTWNSFFQMAQLPSSSTTFSTSCSRWLAGLSTSLVPTCTSTSLRIRSTSRARSRWLLSTNWGASAPLSFIFFTNSYVYIIFSWQ